MEATVCDAGRARRLRDARLDARRKAGHRKHTGMHAARTHIRIGNECARRGVAVAVASEV